VSRRIPSWSFFVCFVLASTLLALTGCQSVGVRPLCGGMATSGFLGAEPDQPCPAMTAADPAPLAGAVEREALADISPVIAAAPSAPEPKEAPSATPTTVSIEPQTPPAKPGGKAPAEPRGAKPKPLTLAAAIRLALETSPQMGLAAAIGRETDLGVDAARAAYMPKLEIRGGMGQSVAGSYRSTSTTDYWAAHNVSGAIRTDSSVSGTQLLYDFGATRADVERAFKARDSQALKTIATTEDVTLAAAQAYLKVQENRELLALADENLAALKAIATLIAQNEQNGNGTQADLKRVSARVLDAEAVRVDQDYELKLSIEKFRRFAHREPDQLKPAPAHEAALPPTVAAALAESLKRNPRILSGEASMAAAQAESLSIRQSELPRISLETEASSKNYRGQSTRTELDVRGMLTISYKLMDGGLASAKREQASARETQAEMRLQSDREDVEADLRQFYLQRGSMKAKTTGLIEGVAASAKARELYREQFMGGKRSLLELLEVQSSYYTARHNAISNGYDQRRTTYGILKSIGRITATLASES
jgi:TolC family type I secretion outer membrane protein